MLHLSTALLSGDTLRFVLESFDSEDTIHTVVPLYGGISAKVYRVEVQGKDGLKSVVLRQFTNREWLKRQPDLVTREGESLRVAQQTGAPVPKLIAMDETGSRCGGLPSVLMSLLPGDVVLEPADMRAWLTGMAEALVHIHAVEAPEHPWTYYTYNDIATLSKPDWSDLPIWDDMLRIVQGPRPEAKQCLIHRDYHPTNMLWQDGQVSGVVDWVNACRGPQGIDVGHCRLNLAQLHGVEVADQFLEIYQRLAGDSFVYDPYWDLVSLIEALPGPPSVYAGWTALGVTGLTDQLVKERYEALVTSVMRRV